MIYNLLAWSILYSFGGGQFVLNISPNIEFYQLDLGDNGFNFILSLQCDDGTHVGYSDPYIIEDINEKELETITLKDFAFTTGINYVVVQTNIYFNNSYYSTPSFRCYNADYEWQSGIMYPTNQDDYVVRPTFNIFDKNTSSANYQLGYNEGYREGVNSGNGVNNVISWFGNVWNALTNFLSLEIAPNLKIGTLITIPIVVGVLFFVLKALIQ